MEFWKEVRRQVLTNELSKRGACKKYGLGWHALTKILAHDEPPGYRGDCIVMAKLDRGFRSLQDYARTMEAWEKRGVQVFFVATGHADRTPSGKALLGVMGVFAELESNLISERTKEGLAAKKARGEAVGRFTPAGKIRAGKWLRDCPFERPITRELLRLHDEEGWSCYQLFSWLRKQRITRRDGSPWTYDVVRKSMARWREWEQNERAD